MQYILGVAFIWWNFRPMCPTRLTCPMHPGLEELKLSTIQDQIHRNKKNTLGGFTGTQSLVVYSWVIWQHLVILDKIFNSRPTDFSFRLIVLLYERRKQQNGRLSELGRRRDAYTWVSRGEKKIKSKYLPCCLVESPLTLPAPHIPSGGLEEGAAVQLAVASSLCTNT